MSEDLKYLQQRNGEWIDIVNRGDAEAYAKLLTEDAVWFPPRAGPVEGREAFKQWLAPFFDRFAYKFDINNERIDIVGNRAIEKASFVSEMTPKDGGNSIRHSGTFMALWLREEDRIWRIERYVDDTDM